MEAEPSQPRPTGTPAARSSRTGASPAPISWLEHGQCATPVPQRAEPGDLVRGSGNTQCATQDAVGPPADVLEVLDRPAAERGEAEVVLVGVLGQVGVQPDVEPLGQLRGARASARA